MLGDDALVLSHRLQQWCTNAPTLEDEVALANIALDLLGQARLLLTRAGAADGSGRDEDAFAYFRDAAEFRNVRLVELDNGDFAECVVRLLVFATWRLALLAAARRIRRPGAGGDRRQGRQGGHLPPRLRGAVGRPPRRRHRPSRTGGWTPRSTRCGRPPPSCSRSTAVERRLVGAGVAVDPGELRRRVRRRDRDRVAGGHPPADPIGPEPDGSASGATASTRPRWTSLLAELQGLARADPEATW